MRRFKTIFAGTALAIVMASPGAARAQSSGDAAPEAGRDLGSGEIVVTAQKREERLIDVPSAVTAIGGATLTERNLTQIEEIAAHTPGLSVSQTGVGVQLTLRGLNASGQGATTAVLVDDVPLTSASSYQQTTTPNFDTYDLQRIEVLRGPQGTLYGASALGGLVKYVTKAPNLTRFEERGQVEVSDVRGGQIGVAVRGAVNIPIIEDAVAIRVSGLFERLPGYIDNNLRGDRNANGGERYGIRGSLLWQASPDFSVRLAAIWQHDDLDAAPTVELVGAMLTPADPPANATSVAHGGDLQRNSRIAEPVKRDAQIYSATLNYNAGPVAITSVTSLARTQIDMVLDDSYESAAIGVTFADFVSPLYGQPISIRGGNLASVRRFNQEIRVASTPGDGPFEYLLGLFYANEKSRITQVFDILSVAQPVKVLTVPFPGGALDIPASYEELAGFGQLTWHVAPNVDVTGGGRYSRNWQQSQATKLFGFATQLTGNVTDPLSKVSDGKATWSGAISWHPVERVNLYARVATGYRPGGPNAIPSVMSAGYLTRYKPDTTVNYELGAKGELFDRRLAFDVSLFTIDWTDIQIPTISINPDTGVPQNFTANGGKARSRGVEYALRFAATPQLSLSVSGSLDDADLRADAPTIGGVRGDQLPYVPRFSNTVSMDYRAPIGGDAKIFAGIDWAYVGARYSNFAATPVHTIHQRLPEYHNVNLRGGVDLGRFQVDAFVTNVTDSRGLYSYLSGAGANATGTGVIQQPRTFGLRFGAEF